MGKKKDKKNKYTDYTDYDRYDDYEETKKKNDDIEETIGISTITINQILNSM